MALWNDILTVLSTTISVILLYYQLREYRARPASPSISASLGRYHTAPLTAGEDGVSVTLKMSALIENKGRNKYTIREIRFDGPEGVSAELTAKSASESMEFGGGASRNVELKGTARAEEDLNGIIEGRITMETPKGRDSDSVAFTQQDPEVNLTQV